MLVATLLVVVASLLVLLPLLHLALSLLISQVSGRDFAWALAVSALLDLLRIVTSLHFQALSLRVASALASTQVAKIGQTLRISLHTYFFPSLPELERSLRFPSRSPPRPPSLLPLFLLNFAILVLFQ